MKKKRKTIEDQGQKQVHALKTLKPKELEAIKDNKYDVNERLLKYKGIFDELSRERIGEIRNMSKEIGFNNLTSYFKDPSLAPIKFISFRIPLKVYEETKMAIYQ